MKLDPISETYDSRFISTRFVLMQKDFNNITQFNCTCLLLIKIMCPCLCFAKKWTDMSEESNSSKNNSEKVPIVYSMKYNVKFCGLQKLHPFDAAKGYHILKVRHCILKFY